MRIALVMITACSGSSPLVGSAPQIEAVANPGGVAEHPRFQLTLQTWNNLATLQDGIESGAIEAMLDGQPLVIDHGATGYFNVHDTYIATFVAPDNRIEVASTSTITVTDQETTWSVEVPDLMTNDLQPIGAMAANAKNTLVWPSSTTTEPYSTIASACVAIGARATACQSRDGVNDPGIAVEKEHVVVDMLGAAGEPFVVWATRKTDPIAGGDGPVFFISVIDRLEGAFE